MRSLHIKNIGPIVDAKIELDKLNVFIGPQSSGKSTITKVASYCSWVEKKTATLEANQTSLSQKNIFEEKLESFHKMYGYLRKGSYIRYETDVVIIEYNHTDKIPTFEWKDRFAYKRCKTSYIPSERNIVAAIPNWMDVKLSENNIRSFMSDWEEARKTYAKDEPLNILNLGANYHYDHGLDYIKINKNKPLILTNTSSGVQSLTPLLVLLNYVYSYIYIKEASKSINDVDEQIEILTDIFKQVLDKQVLDTPDYKEISVILRSKDEINKDRRKKINSLINDLTRIQQTNTYLEEPELNIFPEAQRDLVKEMIRLNNLKDEHSLTITTHSPYILSSINNLMYAAELGKTHKKKVEAIVPSESWIDYDRVRAYYVADGKVTSLLDEETKQMKAEMIDGVSNILNEEYDQLFDLE